MSGFIIYLNYRSDVNLKGDSSTKIPVSIFQELPTQKKLKTENTEDDGKISCRPFQYLSSVKNKVPGTTVIIKG